MGALKWIHPEAGFPFRDVCPLHSEAHMIAVAFEAQDMVVIQKPIEQRADERRIAKDVTPVGERLVTRNDRRPMFVALADLSKSHVAADLSNSTQRSWSMISSGTVFHEALFLAGDAVESCKPNLIEQVLIGKEIDATTGLQRARDSASWANRRAGDWEWDRVSNETSRNRHHDRDRCLGVTGCDLSGGRGKV